eukprot:jgi/Mesvir1/894/Mv17456-RA.2
MGGRVWSSRLHLCCVAASTLTSASTAERAAAAAATAIVNPTATATAGPPTDYWQPPVGHGTGETGNGANQTGKGSKEGPSRQVGEGTPLVPSASAGIRLRPGCVQVSWQRDASSLFSAGSLQGELRGLLALVLSRLSPELLPPAVVTHCLTRVLHGPELLSHALVRCPPALVTAYLDALFDEADACGPQAHADVSVGAHTDVSVGAKFGLGDSDGSKYHGGGQGQGSKSQVHGQGYGGKNHSDGEIRGATPVRGGKNYTTSDGPPRLPRTGSYTDVRGATAVSDSSMASATAGSRGAAPAGRIEDGHDGLMRVGDASFARPGSAGGGHNSGRHGADGVLPGSGGTGPAGVTFPVEAAVAACVLQLCRHRPELAWTVREQAIRRTCLVDLVLQLTTEHVGDELAWLTGIARQEPPSSTAWILERLRVCKPGNIHLPAASDIQLPLDMAAGRPAGTATQGRGVSAGLAMLQNVSRPKGGGYDTRGRGDVITPAEQLRSQLLADASKMVQSSGWTASAHAHLSLVCSLVAKGILLLSHAEILTWMELFAGKRTGGGPTGLPAPAQPSGGDKVPSDPIREGISRDSTLGEPAATSMDGGTCGGAIPTPDVRDDVAWRGPSEKTMQLQIALLCLVPGLGDAPYKSLLHQVVTSLLGDVLGSNQPPASCHAAQASDVAATALPRGFQTSLLSAWLAVQLLLADFSSLADSVRDTLGLDVKVPHGCLRAVADAANAITDIRTATVRAVIRCCEVPPGMAGPKEGGHRASPLRCLQQLVAAGLVIHQGFDISQALRVHMETAQSLLDPVLPPLIRAYASMTLRPQTTHDAAHHAQHYVKPQQTPLPRSWVERTVWLHDGWHPGIRPDDGVGHDEPGVPLSFVSPSLPFEYRPDHEVHHFVGNDLSPATQAAAMEVDDDYMGNRPQQLCHGLYGKNRTRREDHPALSALLASYYVLCREEALRAGRGTLVPCDSVSDRAAELGKGPPWEQMWWDQVIAWTPWNDIFEAGQAMLRKTASGDSGAEGELLREWISLATALLGHLGPKGLFNPRRRLLLQQPGVVSAEDTVPSILKDLVAFPLESGHEKRRRGGNMLACSGEERGSPWRPTGQHSLETWYPLGPDAIRSVLANAATEPVAAVLVLHALARSDADAVAGPNGAPRDTDPHPDSHLTTSNVISELGCRPSLRQHRGGESRKRKRDSPDTATGHETGAADNFHPAAGLEKVLSNAAVPSTADATKNLEKDSRTRGFEEDDDDRAGVHKEQAPAQDATTCAQTGILHGSNSRFSDENWLPTATSVIDAIIPLLLLQHCCHPRLAPAFTRWWAGAVRRAPSHLIPHLVSCLAVPDAIGSWMPTMDSSRAGAVPDASGLDGGTSAAAPLAPERFPATAARQRAGPSAGEKAVPSQIHDKAWVVSPHSSSTMQSPGVNGSQATAATGAGLAGSTGGSLPAGLQGKSAAGAHTLVDTMGAAATVPESSLLSVGLGGKSHAGANGPWDPAAAAATGQTGSHRPATGNGPPQWAPATGHHRPSTGHHAAAGHRPRARSLPPTVTRLSLEDLCLDPLQLLAVHPRVFQVPSLLRLVLGLYDRFVAVHRQLALRAVLPSPGAHSLRGVAQGPASSMGLETSTAKDEILGARPWDTITVSPPWGGMAGGTSMAGLPSSAPALLTPGRKGLDAGSGQGGMGGTPKTASAFKCFSDAEAANGLLAHEAAAAHVVLEACHSALLLASAPGEDQGKPVPVAMMTGGAGAAQCRARVAGGDDSRALRGHRNGMMVVTDGGEGIGDRHGVPGGDDGGCGSADEARLEMGADARESLGVMLAFLDDRFLSHPLLLKLVCFQGLPPSLLRPMVATMTSMRACFGFLGELLEQEEPKRRLRALQVSGALCRRYADADPSACCHMAGVAVRHVQAVLRLGATSGYLCEAMVCLRECAEAVPQVAVEVANLLLECAAQGGPVHKGALPQDPKLHAAALSALRSLGDSGCILGSFVEA